MSDLETACRILQMHAQGSSWLVAIAVLCNGEWPGKRELQAVTLASRALTYVQDELSSSGLRYVDVIAETESRLRAGWRPQVARINGWIQ